LCLAVPAKIIRIKGKKALADFGGIQREISLSLLDSIKLGDYVIVHTGFAIQKLDKKDAEETLQMWKEIADAV
jgi:hydrogenase expression/formation protein HypC